MEQEQLKRKIEKRYGDKLRLAFFTIYHMRISDGYQTIDLWPSRYWRRWNEGDFIEEKRGSICRGGHWELIKSIFM